MSKQKKKQIFIIIIITLLALVVTLLYPVTSKLLKTARTHSYVYSYSLPKDLVVINTSNLPPAQAVPVLLYHGVINTGPVGPNTSRKDFIAQMEMLKRNGYETISFQDYDLFRQGKFILPPKPIIITFDDGRKDSFYTVDEVLRKLDFKATIFIATIKADNKDLFYLGWDELKNVQATGRWDIEAHGKRSHDEVVVDKEGNVGSYLTSRAYTSSGQESIEDYEKRIEADYVGGISDLQEHLGIDPKYFAVPLNHYGADDLSNYDGAHDYNVKLTKQYFKMAFIEAVADDTRAFESFYNYKDSNPYEIKRLEVKSMTPDNLLKTLEHFSAKTPALKLSVLSDLPSFLQDTQLLYGILETDKYFTLLSKGGDNSGRVLFGDWGWKNYSIKATLVREKGRSASIIAYYTNEQNYLSLDWDGQSLRLEEYVDGKENQLASKDIWEKNGSVEFLVSVEHGVVNVFADGDKITSGNKTKLLGGAAGFGVWDPQTTSRSSIRELEIVSLP